MIGNVNALGTGFKGLASYLQRGSDGQQPDRVDWLEMRNLPTRDPEAAARIMAATAHDSTKTEKAVYHFSISFDPGDAVDREAMRQVADRTLRDLGLQDHQAVIVAHRDTAHPHVHVMVNRVHPETGRAWSNFRDYPRIEKSLRAQEVEMGLRVVPGKHARVPEREGAALERVPAPRVRGDAAFAERVREQAGPHLQAARSWAELERGLAEHGLSLRVKGRGMVVSDGRQEVKASELFREASRYRLEKRLGPLADYRARQAVASRAPEPRTPAPPLAERPGREAISGRNAAQEARAPVTERQGYRQVVRRFHDDLRAIYADPEAARRAFDRAAQRGVGEAVAALRWEPERFGALRPGVTPERATQAAPNAYEYAAPRARSDRAELKELAARYRDVGVRARTDRIVGMTSKEMKDAKEGRLQLGREREGARQAFGALRGEAGKVYVEPREALRAIDHYARQHGGTEAARALAQSPHQFGELRGVERSRYLGFVIETSYGGAYERAPKLASLVEKAARLRETRPSAGDVLRAEAAVREATARHSAAVAARAALPHLNVEARVRELAGRFAAVELSRGVEAAAHMAARLAPMIPTSAASALSQAMKLGRDLALGRDQQRGRGGHSL